MHRASLLATISTAWTERPQTRYGPAAAALLTDILQMEIERQDAAKTAAMEWVVEQLDAFDHPPSGKDGETYCLLCAMRSRVDATLNGWQPHP